MTSEKAFSIAQLLECSARALVLRKLHAHDSFTRKHEVSDYIQDFMARKFLLKT